MIATLDRGKNLDITMYAFLYWKGWGLEGKVASHWQGAYSSRLFMQIHFTLSLQLENLNFTILTMLK